ncbi:uncharacterized protein N7473_001402 [Penicillium subrubescens]|uniref:Uncharacterized protein n=1 Tax=Penicillium subrubescens TaxID=1316194 RepID=A0A1Q5T8L1_9EURO|nr:uncharacterized protein N7473_001402 [Penicillium subrubescens]KAJ5912099.1 hypothetical protein N7473_001402 [Penicillium subrubescens]OKO96564.1 hypothetical protein PENSUB_10739 [Penicillium subrubescens]
MANSIQSPSTNPDERMRQAVQRFSTTMESSDRQLLQDRINKIQAMSLSTKEEKIRKMRSYWPDLCADAF